MNAALKLSPDNQKIQTKLRQLQEMLHSRMQGNQLSPTDPGAASSGMFPQAPDESPIASSDNNNLE